VHEAPLVSCGEIEIDVYLEPDTPAKLVLEGRYALDCSTELCVGGWRAAIPWESDQKRADYCGSFRLVDLIRAGEESADGTIQVRGKKLHATILAAEIDAIASATSPGTRLEETSDFVTTFTPLLDGECIGQFPMALALDRCKTYPRIKTVAELSERILLSRIGTTCGKRVARTKALIERKFGTDVWRVVEPAFTTKLEPILEGYRLRAPCEDASEERARLEALLRSESIICDAVEGQFIPQLERALAKAKQQEAEMTAIETRQKLRRSDFYFG
jgi:hypothetical protein